MKSTPLFLLILYLLLAACGGPVTTTQPAYSTNAYPTNAYSTPTPTPTPKLTPTPTENPLAGAPDETATGKDKNGNWIRPAQNPDGTPLRDSKGRQV